MEGMDRGRTIRSSAAVDAGGLQEADRGGLEEGLHHDQVPGADGGGQNHDPEAVQQVEGLDDQVGGDQAAAEQHGEGEEEGDGLPSGQVLPGEGVRAQDGQHQVHRGAHNGIEDGVHVGKADIGVVEDQLVGAGLEAYGQGGEFSAQNGRVAAEGAGQHVNEGVQRDDADQDDQGVVDDLKGDAA